MLASRRLLIAATLAATLAGCKSSGELVVDEGVGVTAVRTACPAVGIPDYTGDVTLFRSPGGVTASDLDVTATMTNVRSQCDETGARVYTIATFDVLARRSDVRGARTVSLPYFVTVLRGGNAVVSKQVGTVAVSFADGQERAQARAQGAAYIDRAAASLPADIRAIITRKRRAGDPDAAIDPMTRPEVRAAVQQATFEVLLGFQLDERQLAYNATR
jgi:hypothetical protein